MEPRQSVHFMSDILASDELAKVVGECESLGYESVWTSETTGRDIFTALTAMAFASSTSRVGAGIAQIVHRHPFEVAMAAKSIDELSGGRLRLGVGVSHAPFIAANGTKMPERPALYMREFLTCLRQMLNGEDPAFEGEYIKAPISPMPIRGHDTAGNIEIWAAALRPGMVRVSAELADGVFVYLSTPSYTARVRSMIDEAAERVGRDPADVQLLIALPTILSNDDVDETKESIRHHLRKYLRMPSYRGVVEEEGLGVAPDAVATDEQINALVAWGTPDDVKALGDEHRAAGATEISYYPIHSRPSHYMGDLRALAPINW